MKGGAVSRVCMPPLELDFVLGARRSRKNDLIQMIFWKDIVVPPYPGFHF